MLRRAPLIGRGYHRALITPRTAHRLSRLLFRKYRSKNRPQNKSTLCSRKPFVHKDRLTALLKDAPVKIVLMTVTKHRRLKSGHDETLTRAH